jgi:tetratricopeptide (TPR) repeat protein
MQEEAPDTYTWLLTRLDGCPACGATIAADAIDCGACGRSLVTLVRPTNRSVTAFSLAGAWVFGLAGSILALIGTLAQVLGVTARTNSPRVLSGLLIGTVALAIFSGVMIWGCVERRPFALYIGIALATLLGAAGVVAGLVLGGTLSLILVIVSVLVASALILMHVSVAREFHGERRRQVFEVVATSAMGLYKEGREYYDAGLHFLAAQRWARAVGKDPTNASYLHSLGLVLAQLGHYERALGQIESAMRSAPDNAEIRKSHAMVRRQAAGQGEGMTR